MGVACLRITVLILGALLAIARAQPDGTGMPVDAGASDERYVIEPGFESLFGEMLGSGQILPGVCALTDGQIDGRSVVATYACADGRVVLQLVHPETAGAGEVRTRRFAVAVKDGAPPAGLLDVVTERIRSREGAFEWATPAGRGSPTMRWALRIAAGAAVVMVVFWSLLARTRRGGPDPASGATARDARPPSSFVVRESLPVVLTALFALGWIAARAHIQSITTDEAATYSAFVGTFEPAYWIPASNNHVLNSMLMRWSTLLFGVSNFTLRLPAFLGAIVYAASVSALAMLITQRSVLRWAVVATLLLNPFIMDYLVAARGYSLALGFLVAAIAVAAWRQAHERDPAVTCGLCSVAIGLSFAANFPFAIADAVVLAGIALWCGAHRRARLLLAALVPGAIVAAALTGTVLAHWPQGEFRWGEATFAGSMRSIGEQLFYRVNESIMGVRAYEWLMHERHWFYPLLIVTCFWRAVTLAADRSSTWLVRLFLLVAAAIPAILLLHGVLAWGFHLPWPRARTGLFLPVLALLALGVGAAIPTPSRMGRASGTALTALLVVMACCSLLCLRLTWFAEWYWNANSDQLYSVVARYNREYGIRQIGANWRYPSVLNYYRDRSGRETLDEVRFETPIPSGRPLYVLFPQEDEAFRRRERLQVVYHDPLSDAVVAIAPSVAERGP